MNEIELLKEIVNSLGCIKFGIIILAVLSLCNIVANLHR